MGQYNTRLSYTGIHQHLIFNMGNDMSHQPYVMRQISADTGRDEHTLQNFYTAFQKECPSGHMTPEDFANLYEKVFSSGAAQDLRNKAFGAFSKWKHHRLQRLCDGDPSHFQWNPGRQTTADVPYV